MPLISLLKAEAIRRGLLDAQAEIDPATAFALVRDMPYGRASDRRPETTLAEWQGTCSGKHYLLQALFAELELASRVMACTTTVVVEPEAVPPDLVPLFEAANRRFVDVHNYLVLTLDGGTSMIIDATWPLASRAPGSVVNEHFVPGQDQHIAVTPQETWPVPEGQDAQEFKEAILRERFTPAELEFREEVIHRLSQGEDG